MSKKKSERTLHTPYVKFDYNNRLIGKSSDARIYRNATLLSAGSYTDSLSSTEVSYDSALLKKYAGNWKSNYLNIDHSGEVLKRIGFVKNPRYEDGKIKGELYIYPITKNARDTIELIDKGLVNWLSVEIMTEDSWDPETNERYAEALEFIGCAVVTSPACEEAKIDDSGPDFEEY